MSTPVAQTPTLTSQQIMPDQHQPTDDDTIEQRLERFATDFELAADDYLALLKYAYEHASTASIQALSEFLGNLSADPEAAVKQLSAGAPLFLAALPALEDVVPSLLAFGDRVHTLAILSDSLRLALKVPEGTMLRLLSPEYRSPYVKLLGLSSFILAMKAHCDKVAECAEDMLGMAWEADVGSEDWARKMFAKIQSEDSSSDESEDEDDEEGLFLSVSGPGV